MHEAKPLPTPLISNTQLSSSQGLPFHDAYLHRSVVGALQYATITMPDLTLSVNKICQFMHAPLDTHWKDVKRILCY